MDVLRHGQSARGWQPSGVTCPLAGVREAGSTAGWGEAAPD